MEDIGFGELLAPVMLQSLYEMCSVCDRGVGERKLYAVHAVRYLCSCKKDRSTDEMINWINHSSKLGNLLPVIPDYALDMHTTKRQEKGRGSRHFFEEASRVNPEVENRDRTYLQRILKTLDASELKD